MSSWPTIVGARCHYNDGSVDFWSYRESGTAEWLVRKVLDGGLRAVEVRLDTGLLVTVRPNRKIGLAPIAAPTLSTLY